jgi:hypothetical protein
VRLFRWLFKWTEKIIFLVISAILFTLVSACFLASLFICLPWLVMYYFLARRELDREGWPAPKGQEIQGNKRDYIRVVR